MGIFLAISCAFLWSVSLILLKIAGDHIHPIILNLGKNVLGLILLVPTAFIVEGALPDISFNSYLMLFMSGFFGIGIADALVLKSLESLAASKVAILECLYTPFVTILAFTFLGETLNINHGVGGVLILSALLLTIPRSAEGERSSWFGIMYMAAGLFTMAVGIILIKPLFATIPLFWIIALRMAAGVVSSILILKVLRNPWQHMRSLLMTQKKAIVVMGFILSSYVSISLWVAGYKYLPASVASVLNQTSTIFTVILASIILREPFEKKKVIAAMLATLGVIFISAHN